jgi:hypothetical protein
LCQKLPAKCTSTDNVFWCFIFFLADFTCAVRHHPLAVQHRAALNPPLNQQPHEHLNSWRRCVLPNDLALSSTACPRALSNW